MGFPTSVVVDTAVAVNRRFGSLWLQASFKVSSENVGLRLGRRWGISMIPAARGFPWKTHPPISVGRTEAISPNRQG